MRSLPISLIVIASLSLASCDRGIATPPLAIGDLKLTLTPATIMNCQSVVLNDPFIENTSLKGRSSVQVTEKARPGLVKRYPNATATTLVLDRAGEYSIKYVIQSPKYPEKLSLTFRCTGSGAESTQDFTVTETSGEQPVSLNF